MISIGDRVKLLVAIGNTDRTGAWDLPVGQGGTVVGFKGEHPIVQFDPVLYGDAERPVTIDVEAGDVTVIPRARRGSS